MSTCLRCSPGWRCAHTCTQQWRQTGQRGHEYLSKQTPVHGGDIPRCGCCRSAERFAGAVPRSSGRCASTVSTSGIRFCTSDCMRATPPSLTPTASAPLILTRVTRAPEGHRCLALLTCSESFSGCRVVQILPGVSCCPLGDVCYITTLLLWFDPFPMGSFEEMSASGAGGGRYGSSSCGPERHP
jgi:hypothetical protein